MVDEANVMRARTVLAEAEIERWQAAYVGLLAAAVRARETKVPANAGLSLLGCEVVVQLVPTPAPQPAPVPDGDE